MSDSKKSKKELIAELEALRSKIQGKPSASEAGGRSGDKLTRREILSAAWVAPVILTVPLGAAVVSPRAHAQVTSNPEPTIAPPPTQSPTQAPTGVPTQAPTNAPTGAPTEQPPQTPGPVPTLAPTGQPPQPPTAFPTAFPTAAADVIPVELSDFDIT